MKRAATYTGIALMFAALALCLFGMAGCASMWQAIKSSAAPAGGGAAGAAVGSLAGPGGTIAGAGLGAMVGDSLEESASLRAGETIGEGAMEKQVLLWRGRAIQADQAASIAEQAKSSLSKLMLYAVLGLVGWLAWRNRHNFRDLGPWHGLVHSILGGKVGK